MEVIIESRLKRFTNDDFKCPISLKVCNPVLSEIERKYLNVT